MGREPADVQANAAARLGIARSRCVPLSRDVLREPVAIEEEMSPLERLRQEIKQPRTWNDIYAMRADELRDRGDELEEDADVFNLNTLSMDK